MAQKSNRKDTTRSKQGRDIATNRALFIFLAGCIGEFYLLLMRRFYINGTLTQTVAWDTALIYLALAGLGIAAVGLVLALALRKQKGWRHWLGWNLVVWGIFMAASSWLTRTYNTTALTPLCIIVPVVAILAVLWGLYDRECFYAFATLGATILVLWLCRKGVGNTVPSKIGRLTWNSVVRICGGIYLLLIAFMALLVRKSEGRGGRVGKWQLLSVNGDCLPVYIACGVSVVSVVLGLLSANVAYYAMLGVALVTFAMLVYYTVKQL